MLKERTIRVYFCQDFKSHKNSNSTLSGLVHIDHIVGNQPDGQMKKVCDFYEKIFNWHRFWTVDDKDINTKYSSLRSIVMANDNEKIKMPINEPADGLKKSQIQEFIDYYETAGIQHLAFSTKDIISTVKLMRKNGVDFLPTPDTYYEKLTDRVGLLMKTLMCFLNLGYLWILMKMVTCYKYSPNLFKIGQLFFLR